MTLFANINLANLVTVFFADAAAAESAADAKDQMLVTKQDDLFTLSGPQMVAMYNTAAAELATNITPVNKFSTKEVGAKRLWANLEDLAADRNAKVEAARLAAAARMTAETVAKVGEPKAPKAQTEPKAPKAPTERTLKDKFQAPAKDVYEFRQGTIGKRALELIQSPISVDELIAELNKVSKVQANGEPGWTRSNLWGSLRYILHVAKGYGLQMKDEKISLVK